MLFRSESTSAIAGNKDSSASACDSHRPTPIPVALGSGFGSQTFANAEDNLRTSTTFPSRSLAWSRYKSSASLFLLWPPLSTASQWKGTAKSSVAHSSVSDHHPHPQLPPYTSLLCVEARHSISIASPAFSNGHLSIVDDRRRS